MKKIGITLYIIVIVVLAYTVVYPWNLGERTPIWRIKERFFSEEMIGLRTQYYVSMSKSSKWYELHGNLLVTQNKHGYGDYAVYIHVNQQLTKDCRIYSSGEIEWRIPKKDMVIHANVFTDEEWTAIVNSDYYHLSDSESIRELEENTGLDTGELTGTLSLIRKEFRTSLDALSESEYNQLCKLIRNKIIVIAGMLLLAGLRISVGKYKEKLDKDRQSGHGGVERI